MEFGIKRKNKGFTLLELVIVIGIIAILLAIAIPRFQRTNLSAEVTAHNANVKMIKNAVILYLSDHSDVEIKEGTISSTSLSPYIEGDFPKPSKLLSSKEFKITILDNGDIKIEPGEVQVSEDKIVEKNNMKIVILIMVGSLLGSLFYNLEVFQTEKDLYHSKYQYKNYINILLRIRLFPILIYQLFKRRLNDRKRKVARENYIFHVVGILASIYSYLQYNKLSYIILFIVLNLQLLKISVIDYKCFEIFNIDLLFLLILRLIFNFSGLNFNKETVICVMFWGLFIFLIYFLTKGMGFGDVLLNGCLLTYLRNWMDGYFFMSFSFIIGAFIAILLIIWKKKEKVDQMPFAPCLTSAFIFIFTNNVF